jgi:hypothetical protein
VAFVRWARAQRIRVELFFFEFPDDPVAASVRRQLDRGARRGKAVTAPFAAERAMKNLARSSSGRWTLEQLGVPVHRIDATRPIAETAQRIRQALGLDPALLEVESAPLQRLQQVAEALGIEAWVGAGHFYRPFWNGRFGPVQRPTDVDVAVDRPEEIAPLLRALQQAHPQERWSVLAPSAAVAAKLGISTGSAREAKAFTRLLHRGGLVRWNGAGLEWHFAPGAEAALRGGVLRLNAALFERLDPAQRSAMLARVAEKIPRTLSDYPGLGLDRATCERLGAGFVARAPRPVASTWTALKTEVASVQQRRREVAFCRRALGPEEREVAEEILRFHRRSPRSAEGPPPPVPVPLPAPLEARRALPHRPRSAEDLAVPAPTGSAGWLHHLGLEAGDGVFREWLHEQVHHHRPPGGADPFLRALLSFELFPPRLREASKAQSAMHQGWTLERHLAASALALDTAEALDACGTLLDRRKLRLALRLAMLFHDTGKLVTGPRPRRHPVISARLFAQHRPAWFPDELVPLTRWMIESHDLFGAFGRGITEKQGAPVGEYALDLGAASSYPGALDAQALRARLLASGLPLAPAAVIAKALWRADIGSIAALRWLLPVAERVERLVLCAPGELRRRMR